MTPFTPAWFLTIFLLPALISGILFLLASLRSDSPSRFWIEAAWSLVIGIAMATTIIVDDGLPNPLFSTRGLYLLITLPVLVALGILGALPKVPRKVVWGLRALVAMGMPVLLLRFKWSSEAWSWPTETLGWLIALGLGVALIWLTTQRLAERAPGRSLTFNLGLCCAVTGAFFCMSGGIVLGSFALALGIAIAGALLMSLRLPKIISNRGSLAVALPALLGLLVQARFLQAATPPIGILLIALAPLTQWVSQIPFIARRKPWQIGLIRTIAILIPLLAALIPVAWVFFKNVPEEGY